MTTTSDKLKNAGVYSGLTLSIVAVLLDKYPDLEGIKEPLFILVNMALVALKTFAEYLKNLIEEAMKKKGYDIKFTKKDGEEIVDQLINKN